MNPKKYIDQFMALEEAAKNEIIELLKKTQKDDSSNLMSITAKMNYLQLRVF